MKVDLFFRAGGFPGAKYADFAVNLWGSMLEKVTMFEDGPVFTLTSGEDVRV